MSKTSVLAPRRRVGVAVVVALVGSLIGAATSSAPVSALSTFAISLVPQEPLIAGTSGDVLLSITNNGPDESTNGSLSATFPVGFMPVAVDDNTCTVSPQPAPPAVPIPTDVDCPDLGPLGAMAAGETVAIMVRVEIDPDYVFDNGGGAGSATADVDVEVTHDDGTQTATKTVIIGERSDLRVRKYASEPVAFAGDIVTYQIDVDNLGPSTARNVTVQDTLMGHGTGDGGDVSIQSCAFSVSQGGGSITQFTCTTGTVVGTQFGTDIGTFGTNKLEPINLLDGDVGGRLRASFRLTVNDATWFDNEVRVLSDTPDPNSSNNMANAALSFQAVADLSITKTASVPTPLPGDLVVYTITATNNGPSDATNVIVKDLLPAGLEFVSATTPGGTCLSGTPGDIDDPVTCNLGSIVKPIAAVAQSEVITLTARVAASATPGAVIFNRAMVSSDTPDLDNANDAAEASIEVETPVADTLLFNPLVPVRQFDTRDGTGGVPIAKLSAGVPLEFEMAGANGVPLDAAAVALNVTVTGPVAEGWLLVYPCDSPPVEASNLNFVAGQTVPNAVIAPIDAAGKVCFLSPVDTDVLSDVSGWFAAGEGMTTLSPVREFDTRTGLGGVPMGKRSAGSVLTFKVTGVNGVPASGVGAVALNVTVTKPDGAGYVTVFPCGELPTASNINYTEGQTVPNLVIAPVSPQGTVCFMTSEDTHLLADVSAWFEDGSDHHAVNPVRVLDTRTGLGGVAVRRLLDGETYEVDLAGRLGVPASGAGSVVLNVTVTGPLLPGYITVFPCGVRPLSSNVNYTTGQAVANAVIAPLSTDGTVCFYTAKSTHLVVDLAGWFTGAGV